MNIGTKAFYRFYQYCFKLVMATDILDWKEPEILEGSGAVKKLPLKVKEKGIDKVLVVTDKGLSGLHLPDAMYEELEKAGVEYVVFDQVQPNPSIENIEAARRAYLDNNCKGLIAFGGGSPMDCAKVCGARVSNPGKTVQQMRGLLHVRKKLPILFAVPTTAGTGSEVTIAAVVTDEATHEKYPINDPKLRPKVVALDPDLTIGLPPHITSTTGMDALTHAVEAFIGRSNVANTEDHAKKAVKLIFENIEKAYADGKDIEARNNMLKGSYHAGLAFTRAYVGYVHSIGHNLGGFYHVPHGLAMSVLLPNVLEYYGETAYKRLAILADVVGIGGATEEEKAKAFIQAIRDMNSRMNIPAKFDMIKDEDIPTIAKRALKEGNPLYPVPKFMGQKECEAFIKSMKA